MLELMLATPPPALGSSANYALFGGGSISTYTDTTSKYDYGTDVSKSGTTLKGGKRAFLAGLGPASFGMFAGGSSGSVIANVDVYAYATDVVSAGVSISPGRAYVAGVSNADIGYVTGGYNSSGSIVYSTVDRYLHADGTRSSAAVLGQGRYYHAAVGNSTFAVMGGGSTASAATNYTDLYTYSTSTKIAGKTLGLARYALCAVGNATIGYFAGGNASGANTTGDEYNYANNTRVGTTGLGVSFTSGSSASGPDYGLFVMNDITVLKCDYSSKAITNGTALSVNRINMAGTSSAPGGF